MARFDLDNSKLRKLQQAMKYYAGNTETSINEVLHNAAGGMIRDTLYNVMPQSNRKPWKGKNPKKPPAKTSKSLRILKDKNLEVTVATTYNYHYLYFPDDGHTTENHQGGQHFFERSGEMRREEIIDLCIAKLSSDFENAI